MPKRVQIRRGTTAQHATFTGAVGEVTYDTDKKSLVVHDGVITGGIPIYKWLELEPAAGVLTEQELKGRLFISGGNSANQSLFCNFGGYFGGNLQAEGDFIGGRLRHQFSTLAYSGTLAWNLGTGTGFTQVTLGGNLTITTSGYLSGFIRNLVIVGDGSLRTLTFPASWKWVGSMPANIAANKIGMLELWCRGTTEAETIARWTVEP